MLLSRIISWNGDAVVGADGWSGVSMLPCLCSRISPPCLLWWDVHQAADVWNSLSALWDFSILSAVDSFSGAYLNRGASFFSCSCAFSWCLNTHIPATYKPTPDLRSKHPSVSTRTILTLSALLGSARSKAICPPFPWPFTVLLSINPSSLFLSLKDEKKKKIPSSILKRPDDSFSYSSSDSFTHSVWHQQSPLLLLSLPLYTAFISLCVYTCSFHRLGKSLEDGVWGGFFWFQPRRIR